MDHKTKLKILSFLSQKKRLSQEIINDYVEKINEDKINFDNEVNHYEEEEEIHYQQGSVDILEDAINLISGNQHLVKGFNV